MADLQGKIDEKRYVIKPKFGTSSKGISLIDNGFELFSRRKFSDPLTEIYGSNLPEWGQRDFIVEELIRDVDSKSNPYLNIPRDFKCFAANGEFVWVNVYDRNYSSQREQTVACYDENWHRLPKTTESYRDAKLSDKPPFFEELKDAVCRISRHIPYVMRFDFFLTEKGPVFGEFTHTSSEGLSQTEFGERTQLQLLYLFPDTLEPIHDQKLLE